MCVRTWMLTKKIHSSKYASRSLSRYFVLNFFCFLSFTWRLKGESESLSMALSKHIAMQVNFITFFSSLIEICRCNILSSAFFVSSFSYITLFLFCALPMLLVLLVFWVFNSYCTKTHSTYTQRALSQTQYAAKSSIQSICSICDEVYVCRWCIFVFIYSIVRSLLGCSFHSAMYSIFLCMPTFLLCVFMYICIDKINMGQIR